MIKMKVLFSIFFIAVFSSVSAQTDYDPFPRNLTFQFKNSTNDTISSIRIDTSYISGKDTVHLFNKVAYRRAVAYNNIFGHQMIEKKGVYSFVFSNIDTFCIYTQVPIGTNWNFNKKLGIVASYAGDTLIHFLGISDSSW